MAENTELRKLIDQASADAEVVQDLPDDGAPIPSHCKVSQPGLYDHRGSD